MSHDQDDRQDEQPALRHIVCDRLDFNALASESDLDECRRFLAGQAPPAIDRVRIGRIGTLEAFLARSTDSWDVDFCLHEATGRAGEGRAEVARLRLLRSDLLKAFAAPAAHAVEDLAGVSVMPSPQVAGPAGPAGRTLHGAADVRDLMLLVLTRMKIPHVDVCIPAFSDVERQRAQSRIRQLAEAEDYNSLGSIAAVATLIIGTIIVTLRFLGRTMEQRFVDAYVSTARLWDHAIGLVVATICAWLAGKILGVLWCRLRLLMFLSRVRHRARLQEQEGLAEH